MSHFHLYPSCEAVSVKPLACIAYQLAPSTGTDSFKPGAQGSCLVWPPLALPPYDFEDSFPSYSDDYS